MATLMTATMFASIATVTAEEEGLYYYDFDVPTKIAPEDAKLKPENQGKGDTVELECYDAWLSQPTSTLKIAYFKIWNNGDIWADAPFYTDILIDGSEETYKTHIVDLAPNSGRSCSKAFYYYQNGQHTFQCWTDSGNDFIEDDENDNYDPSPASTVSIT